MLNLNRMILNLFDMCQYKLTSDTRTRLWSVFWTSVFGQLAHTLEPKTIFNTNIVRSVQSLWYFRSSMTQLLVEKWATKVRIVNTNFYDAWIGKTRTRRTRQRPEINIRVGYSEPPAHSFHPLLDCFTRTPTAMATSADSNFRNLEHRAVLPSHESLRFPEHCSIWDKVQGDVFMLFPKVSKTFLRRDPLC